MRVYCRWFDCRVLRHAMFIGALITHPAWSQDKTVDASICSHEIIGDDIPASLIGEPVAAVAIETITWRDASDTVRAHCWVAGSIKPVDTSASAQSIHFALALPDSWNRRAIQLGGAGMNGRLPALTGNPRARGDSELNQGYVTYGSDSGHGSDPGWLLNEEAIRNFGYMQMKKTRDAAFAIMERVYGAEPEFNYYIGSSQGGREALTVAQRYAADYDGIYAAVPVVNFTALMESPTLVRIQERKIDNWVHPNKGKAIAAEFMRQCDDLDGLMDGVINNYIDCRARFNVSSKPQHKPWAALRCPDNRDPNPDDSSEAACLTDGQIDTLRFVFSTRQFSAAVANGVDYFGMWLPTTTVAGNGMGQLFTAERFKGQQGAPAEARRYTTLGVDGLTGFMMQDYTANPLDYDATGKHFARRKQLSEWLDATDPDLTAFRERGGKLIIVIGTDDAIASSGAQIDYYQTLLNTMGRDAIDSFARLYVLPQAGHILTGTRYPLTGDGKSQAATPLPTRFDRLRLLVDWVENGVAPDKSAVVSGQSTSGLMCSFPTYPHYRAGDRDSATAYRCAQPAGAVR